VSGPSRPRRRPWRAALQRAALVLAGASAGVLASELATRLGSPERSLIWRPGPGRTLHPDPNHLPGVQGPARFEVGSLGLRARPLEPGAELRIVALGGSTTECVALDTDEAWPALLGGLLERALGIPTWVGNGGRSGLRARHHVLQAREVIASVPDVDVIVLTAGLNDLLEHLGAPDRALDWRADPVEGVRVLYQAFEVPARPRAGPLLERLELVRRARLARVALGRMRVPRATLEAEVDGRSVVAQRAARAAATELHDDLPPLEPALSRYRADLRDVARAAAEGGVTLVLVTQPALWAADLAPAYERLLWMGVAGRVVRGESAGAYYTPAALARGLRAFNRATLEVCAEAGLPCVDLAGRVPRDTTAFYDDVHFNEAGARLVARRLADELGARLRPVGSGGAPGAGRAGRAVAGRRDGSPRGRKRVF
jgi:lysophospholipase L1-like esterase